jgi:DNA-directed RNA polymerase beta subunit
MNNEINNINKENNIKKDNIENVNIELNSLEFEKYTWEIIKKYFDQDNGKYIINHILSSYNDFVFRKIDDIIDGFNPINIQYNYVEDKDIFQYNIKLNILNPRISKPITQEKNGTIKIMTPNEARQRNFCYSGNLCVDLEIEIEYYNIDENYTNENYTNEDINENVNENINKDNNLDNKNETNNNLDNKNETNNNLDNKNETNNNLDNKNKTNNNEDNKNKTNNNLDNIDIIIKKKIIQNINLGKIPIMVNSKYCVLNNPNLNLNNNSECKYDLGGYFIINGNEKVVISQDRIAGNKTYVFKDTKSTTYSYIAEIRSVPENIFSPQKLTILKLSTQENSYGKTIKGVIHHIKYDIPIFILFRALGIESDKEIIKYILFDLDNKNNKILINNLKGCVEESNYYLTQFSALEYISKYLSITGYSKEYLSNKTHKIKIIKNILKNDFLPHVSQCYKKKAIYLGYMIRKLILCSLNIIELDDRDSYINKRIDTPGIMMSNLFRQYYGKLIKDMKIIINKEYSVGSWKGK